MDKIRTGRRKGNIKPILQQEALVGHPVDMRLHAPPPSLHNKVIFSSKLYAWTSNSNSILIVGHIFLQGASPPVGGKIPHPPRNHNGGNKRPLRIGAASRTQNKIIRPVRAKRRVDPTFAHALNVHNEKYKINPVLKGSSSRTSSSKNSNSLLLTSGTDSSTSFNHNNDAEGKETTEKYSSAVFRRRSTKSRSHGESMDSNDSCQTALTSLEPCMSHRRSKREKNVQGDSQGTWCF